MDAASSSGSAVAAAAATAARLRNDGANEVPAKTRHPVLPFLRHFWGLSAWMLELIALLSYVRRKQADSRVAIALLVVNAILGFVQEQRAAVAVALLRRRLDVQARALRDGHWSAVAARSLVKGDLVRVRAGDFVPADMQVIDGEAKIDQSALTGESQEVARRVDETLYQGSTVREGEATAVVTATDVAKGAASVPCVASRYGADGGAVRGRVRGRAGGSVWPRRTGPDAARPDRAALRLRGGAGARS